MADLVTWVDALKVKRDNLIEEDITVLRDAAHILEVKGNAFQRDIYERIYIFLDGLSKKKEPYVPKPFHPTPKTYQRPFIYAKVDAIRSQISNEAMKRALYTMTFEISDNDMEYLLILFREGMSRFASRHKNIFTAPPGVKEIQYYLSTLGIIEVVPQDGEPFDPTWHVHADLQKTGFDYAVSKTIHPGYKRNERRLLKAVVEVI
ncbi:MAG: nucleotide exchange factor GrpE [Defluviitaleaceae bacterium]|nr:nucleotide exchange factor GrpE [Defluviitaleaceae bacterium]